MRNIFKKREKGIDIKNVIEYLRSKGLAVKQTADTSASFKMNDENLFVDVSEGRFHLTKSYRVDKDVPMELLLVANNHLMLDRYCIKAFVRNIPEFDQEGKPIDGTLDCRELVFSCELLCDNYDDFVNHYEWTIWALLDGVKRHGDIVQAYVETSQQESEQQHRIGFSTGAPEDQNAAVSKAGHRRKIGFNQEN